MHFKLLSRTRRVAGLLVALLLAAGLLSPAAAQDRTHVPSEERVDPKDRRQSDLDGNNVRTTIFNFGLTGRTEAIPGEIPYEWPKNTRQYYIAMTQLFVGAEVTSESGEQMWIVDLANGRDAKGDRENISWNFEPIPGYASTVREEEIARSGVPETWPTCWPDKQDDASDPGWCGSWNGYFGKDVFNADQEFFFRMGDDQYDRYILPDAENKYYPDSTDLTRGGLGLIVDTRAMAWSQILIDDVVFVLHSIKNDGTKDLDKVGVTVWLADFVGGDGGDDQPYYDLLEDIAWMTDQDGQGPNFGPNETVGVAGVSFLETPGNARDRIDNDGDGSTNEILSQAINEQGLTTGEPGSPRITEAMLSGECAIVDDGNLPRTCYDGVDNNGNGLIDENQTYIRFTFTNQQGQVISEQEGVGYADYIDNDRDGEQSGPTVTQDMVNQAAGDRWNRWPTGGSLRDGEPVHLVGVGAEDIGMAFRDGIDNDGSCENPTGSYPYATEPGSPTVTQAMIDAAANDAPYYRYRVPGTSIFLYDLKQEDLGLCYADGVDNDNDGATDEGMDEGMDEMIDESRSDGIDNDGDWRPQDDTGLDGADFTGDVGEGDGQPSSGAGTELPGEPNVDVTDISESDQIGITNVQYLAAGNFDSNTTGDGKIFRDFMVPGSFYDPTTELTGDYDLFVSSGVFPLAAGQTERFSMAVTLGEDQEDVLRKRTFAVEAYEADYKFAQAPPTPTVEAVPGNGQVTLYWDTAAEDAYDSFIADLGLGLNPRDFEGYRIYRATDPSFVQAREITDGFGNSQFLKPIAQFDRDNTLAGFHPVDVNGTKFWLGENTGVQNVYVDTTAVNGITYYYAVTAYDFGAVFPPQSGRGGDPTLGEVFGVPPTETPVRIRQLTDGSIETGTNVVEVTPTERAAGYNEAYLGDEAGALVPRVAGFTTSRIGYEIVDPRVVQDGHTYRVSFSDTLREGSGTNPDTLTTNSFTLVDVTAGDTLVARSNAFQPGARVPVVDGFRLRFFNDPVIVMDEESSGWVDDTSNHAVELEPFLDPPFVKGRRTPNDYRVEVVELGEGQSEAVQLGLRDFKARETNVRVYRTNTQSGGDVEVPYAFADRTGDAGGLNGEGPAIWNVDIGVNDQRSDFLILLEDPNPDDGDDELIPTWRIALSIADSTATLPEVGDVARIVTKKPFLRDDVFEFTAHSPMIEGEEARASVDDVLVVPNPYRASSAYEQTSVSTYGRNREIQFKNLPTPCTIRIFTTSGHLVKVIEHPTEGSTIGTADMMNGSASWDLVSKDGLAVSYGLYLYHVESEYGETTGTFALIK